MTVDATTDFQQVGPLFCYRHPDRETYVRCGRCDQPICTNCAMQGPVGLRCKKCGTPPRDPLTRLSPTQLAAGGGAAIGAGSIGGLIGLQIGFGLFIICIGPFIGGLIAESVLRVTGYKRGPIIRLLIATGIVGGLLVAVGFQYSMTAQGIRDLGVTFGDFISAYSVSGIIYIAAAMVGAFARLR